MLYVLSESVKLATDLLVATVKTTGSTGKAVAAMLAAHWKNSTQKEMGEISLKAMVKRKEPFDMLAMDTVDAGKFRRLANQVGIRADKSDYDDMTVDGLTSVLYRQQDAPLVKSILERLHINTLVTAQTEDIAEITPEQQNALQNAENPVVAPVTEEAPVMQQVDDMTAMQQVVRQQMEQNLTSSAGMSTTDLLDRNRQGAEKEPKKETPLAEDLPKMDPMQGQSITDLQKQLTDAGISKKAGPKRTVTGSVGGQAEWNRKHKHFLPVLCMKMV